MIHRVKRRSFVIDFLLAAAVTVSGALPAFAGERHRFDVPSQEAAVAIRVFAAQAEVQMLASGEVLKDKSLRAVSGDLSTEEGLRTLLAGSGLTHQYVGDRSIALVDDARTPSWRPIRVAQADAPAAQAESQQGQRAATAVVLEEVIVSAQKRGEERLQDVPVPVSVLDASQLASNSQLRIRDYYSAVPGLSMAPLYLGRQELSIRGVMTGGQSNPTVGITIDDVPYGASTVATGGPSLPDIDPGDLARIEVLRGPQGTLYGANSMGGLIKYVTVDPSFEGYRGRLETGAYGVHNGDGPGYNVRASLNAPLSDAWAIRASAFIRQDSGYIDNPVLNIDGVNDTQAAGGRLAALWRPSDNFSLKLSALYQRTEADGAPEVEAEPGLGDLQQNFLRDTRGYDVTVQLYSAVLQAKLGSVDLTSVSSYSFNDFSATDDRSPAFGAAVFTLYGVTGVRYLAANPRKKYTQEVRLAGPAGERLEWLLGAFYTHEKQDYETTMVAENIATGQSAGPFFHSHGAPGGIPEFEEYAAFGGLTFHVTDRFDLQLGARESRNTLVNSDFIEGPFTMAVLNQPSPVVTLPTESETDAFTFLVTPRFKVSSDLMVYARLASGYRPGGPNSVVAIAAGAPSEFQPDETLNYEIGLKGDFLDHVLSIDASLYYIDWRDIQIGQRLPTAVYSANGGRAKSAGVELSLTSRPSTGLTISAWAAYNDAVLEEAFPSTATVVGRSGDRLPFATRFSGSLSFEQEFSLWSDALGFVGGTVNYVGDRLGTFQATPVRQALPSYAKTDLRTGVRYDSWTTEVYVNNVADKRGLINGGIGYIPTNVFAYIQPRTIGLSVSKAF